MEHGKEYYAFISYKREDEKWAKWLQNKLEHYCFPTNLNGRTDLPKNIRPTFRDVTDLTSGLLVEELDKALRSSEWLIIICSPRSAKSPWVCKEAQAFIELGRADHIIPFIIEGTPFSGNEATECYPQALLNLTDSCELLAININEMGRDSAAIKVVARMFNLRFDTLWQRYEREKRWKGWVYTWVATIIAIIAIAIGVRFATLNREIQGQYLQLQTATDRLKEDSVIMQNHLLRIQRDSLNMAVQNDSISLQASVILDQRDRINNVVNNLYQTNERLRRSNALISTENSLFLLSSGNLLRAKDVLMDLYKNNSDIQLLALPKVEFAFRKVYREMVRDGITISFALDNLGEISLAQFDKIGANLYVIVNNFEIIRCDVASGVIKERIMALPTTYDKYEVDIYAFDDAAGNLYYTLDGIAYCKNIHTNDNRQLLNSDKYIDFMIVSPNFNYIACYIDCDNDNSHRDYWCLVDMKNDSNDSVIPTQFDEIYQFSKDEKYIIAKIDGKYCIYDITNNSIEREIPYDGDVLNVEITNDGGNIIFKGEDANGDRHIDIYNVYSNEYITLSNPINYNYSSCSFAISPKQHILVLGKSDGSISIYDTNFLWAYHIIKNNYNISGQIIDTISNHAEYIDLIQFSMCGAKMLSVSNGKVSVWNVNTKDVVQKINSTYHYACSNGLSYVRTNNDYAYLYDAISGKPISGALFENNRKTNESVKFVGRDNANVITKRDNRFYTLYNINNGTKVALPFSTDKDYSVKIAMDNKGEIMVVYYVDNNNCHTLISYDIMHNTIIAKKEDVRQYFTSIALSPDGDKLIMSSFDEILIYDTRSLSLISKLPHPHSGGISHVCYSPDGSKILSASSDRLVCLWDTHNKSLLGEFYGAERELRSCSISSDNKYIIAATIPSFTNSRKVLNYIWSVETREIVEAIESEYEYNFCQDVPDKLYSRFDFTSFPSIDAIINHLATN